MVFFIFLFNFRYNCLLANSGDPDQPSHYVASDLSLHCLPMSHKNDDRLILVNACYNISCCSFISLVDDEVWTTAFGKENFDTGREVDSNSKFIIASVTKAFTGTLLQMLLSEKGYVQYSLKY